MKWDELTAEQRNKLVHEKVMGGATVCSGKLRVAHGKGISLYSCDTCNLLGCCSSEDDIPREEHPPKVDIPSYTKDMNTAWQIVERFDEIIISNRIPKMYHCELYSSTGGYTGIAETPQEAICIAALRSVGVDIE